MRVLLIDMRDWEQRNPKAGERVQQVQEAILLGDPTGTIEPREEICVRESCDGFDAVVIHCSRNQTDAGEFLERCCTHKPVLGYAFGGRTEITRRFFKNYASSAFIQISSKRLTTPSPDSLRISRWVSSILYANGDPEAIKRACNIASGLDEELEEQLLKLREDWIRGEDPQTLRKTRDQYPKLGTSC